MSRAPAAARGLIGFRWPVIAGAIYVAVNIGLTLYSLNKGLPFNPDWALWTALPGALENGTPYQADAPIPFVWSPLMAWVMAAMVLYVGFWPWAALHLGVVALLRDPVLIALTLGTWGFWLDLGQGNTFVFAFVAGVLALRGSQAAAIAYLAILILMPRPIQVPLAIWLVVTMPRVRIPFVAMFVAHFAVVLATGYGDDWIRAMLAFGPGGHPYDLGPARWLGRLWLVISLPLTAWLLYRGYVGWSGVAVSPYLLPQYLLMPLTDLWRERARRTPGRVDVDDG